MTGVIKSPSLIGLNHLKDDESFRKNLKQLSKPLEKDEIFLAKGDRIHRKNVSNLFQKIHYCIWRNYYEGKVRSALDKFLVQLDYSDTELTEKQEKTLKEFVFKRLAPLSLKIFDRSQIHESLVPILYSKIYEMEGIDRKIAKAKFALKLGIPLKPVEKGTSGTYFARDYKLKFVGVFKPASEESLGGNSPKLSEKIKAVFYKAFNISPLASFNPNEGYLAEVLTSEVAEHLKFSTVPRSRVVTFQKVGSFQAFVKETKSMRDMLHIKGETLPGLSRLALKLNLCCIKKKTKKVISQRQFQELVVIDFLTFNRDRHTENLLIDKKKNLRGKRDIHLIDNQLAFPKSNPTKEDFLYKFNQFLAWEYLPHGDRPFSKRMAAYLQEMLTGDKLEEMIDALKEICEKEGKPLDTEEEGVSKESALRQRVQVLIKFINEERPIKELARIKTQEDIDKFLDTFSPEESDSHPE